MSDVEEGKNVTNGFSWNNNPGSVEDEEAVIPDFNRAEAIPQGHERPARVRFRQLVGWFPRNERMAL